MSADLTLKITVPEGRQVTAADLTARLLAALGDYAVGELDGVRIVCRAARAEDARPRDRGRHVTRDAHGLTPVQNLLYEALKARRGPQGLVSISTDQLLRETRVGRGNWGSQIKALLESRKVQLMRPGVARSPAVYRIFDEPQAEFPPSPLLPLPAKKAKAQIALGDGRGPGPSAAPVRASRPDAPLVPPEKRRAYIPQAKYHPKTGALLNPYVIGSAAQYDIGTAEERVAAVPETELERIARMYGATVKKKDAAE